MLYLYQKDKWALPGNLQNRRYSSLPPPPPNVVYLTTTLTSSSSLIQGASRVEEGSNTSTVALRVVEGNEN
jgi:hypothetical protein